MRLKDTLIFWTDVAIALLMAGLVATGTIIKWVLPPGSGRGDVGGTGGDRAARTGAVLCGVTGSA